MQCMYYPYLTSICIVIVLSITKKNCAITNSIHVQWFCFIFRVYPITNRAGSFASQTKNKRGFV